MSLLSYNELIRLQVEGVIQDSLPEHVNSSSIDVTLGRYILREDITGGWHHVILSKRDAMQYNRHDLWDKPFYLMPGDFVLASTEQVFNLPNDISAEYKLKSSMGRVGLNHLTAGWCDAGWHGSVLTLELHNVTRSHVIVLEANVPIGQVTFYRHTPVPDKYSYATRGRYNGDLETKGVKA